MDTHINIHLHTDPDDNKHTLLHAILVWLAELSWVLN